MTEAQTRKVPDGPSADGATPAPSGEFVQSLARGFAVIRAFDEQHPQLTLSEVAKRAGLSRATARRFLFTLVTLPVELNASHRARQLLSASGLVSPTEMGGVSAVLNAAALTYVAALAQVEVELQETVHAKLAAESARNVAQDALAKAEVARHKAAEEALAAAKARDAASTGGDDARRELDKLRRRVAELEKAGTAGVEAKLDVFPEQQHTFQMAAGRAPEADDAIQRFAGWVRPPRAASTTGRGDAGEEGDDGASTPEDDLDLDGIRDAARRPLTPINDDETLVIPRIRVGSGR